MFQFFFIQEQQTFPPLRPPAKKHFAPKKKNVFNLLCCDEAKFLLALMRFTVKEKFAAAVASRSR
jgi:hypothetical protein